MFLSLTFVNYQTTLIPGLRLSSPMGIPKIRFQGLLQRNEGRVAGVRPISSATNGAVTTHLLGEYHGEGVLSMRRRQDYYCSIDANVGPSFEPLLSSYTVSAHSSAVISGYWIGPDVEDEWGFVEASVCRIF